MQLQKITESISRLKPEAVRCPMLKLCFSVSGINCLGRVKPVHYNGGVQIYMIDCDFFQNLLRDHCHRVSRGKCKTCTYVQFCDSRHIQAFWLKDEWKNEV